MRILVKLNYANFGVSNFFPKLSKNNLLGVGLLDPLVKEGLKLCNARSKYRLTTLVLKGTINL